MNEEILNDISHVALISKENALMIIEESGLSLWEVYKFYVTFCRFPTMKESSLIKSFGVDNVILLICTLKKGKTKFKTNENETIYIAHIHE